MEKQLYIIDNEWIIDFIPTIGEAIYMCSNLTHLTYEEFKINQEFAFSYPGFKVDQLCNAEPDEYSDLCLTNFVIYHTDKEGKIWHYHDSIKILKIPKLLDESIKKSLNK